MKINNEGSENDSFKVIVKGIPFRATEEDLRQFFDECGEITSLELRYRKDGRPDGTALISFATEESLKSAVSLHGKEMDGRWLAISPVSESKDNNFVAFIGNLPYDATTEGIQALFDCCGEIKEVRIATERDTGRSRGFGHIEFANDKSLQNALKQDLSMNGRELRVMKSEGKGSGGRGGRGGRGGHGDERGGFHGGRGRGGFRGGDRDDGRRGFRGGRGGGRGGGGRGGGGRGGGGRGGGRGGSRGGRGGRGGSRGRGNFRG